MDGGKLLVQGWKARQKRLHEVMKKRVSPGASWEDTRGCGPVILDIIDFLTSFYEHVLVFLNYISLLSYRYWKHHWKT